MSGILDNELVKKYFGEYKVGDTMAMLDIRELALRVLAAMQGVISKKERCLGWVNGDIWQEEDCAEELGNFHPTLLRLPDQFQKRECGCTKRPDGHHTIDGVCRCCCHQPQREAVEEKIRGICKQYQFGDAGEFAYQLRELVRLALDKNAGSD